MNFTKSHLYVCTDELFVWKYFCAVQIFLTKSSNTYKMGLTAFHGDAVDTPVERWVAVSGQDTTARSCKATEDMATFASKHRYVTVPLLLDCMAASSCMYLLASIAACL